VPHGLVHADHADHADTAQLTGQARVLHCCDCDNAGHERPPWAAATVTERICICTPPPHVLEHADHADHALT